MVVRDRGDTCAEEVPFHLAIAQKHPARPLLLLVVRWFFLQPLKRASGGGEECVHAQTNLGFKNISHGDLPELFRTGDIESWARSLVKGSQPTAAGCAGTAVARGLCA